jgi:hypothetical protein
MASLSNLWRAFQPSAGREPVSTAPGRGDARLRAYREAEAEAEAERRLDDLLRETVTPAIRATLRQRGLTGDAANALFGTIAAQVVERLRRERTGMPSPDALPPILYLEGYVAAVAHRAVDSDLRARCPERARLRRGLRYVLSHAPGLAGWEQDGACVCGRAAWRDAGRRTVAITDEDLAGRVEEEASGRAGTLVTLAFALVDAAGGPIPFDTLAAAAAQVRGIADDVVSLSDMESQPLKAEPMEAALLRRDYLERVWAEVRRLSPRQCAALLLNLRDAGGRGVLELLLAVGLADKEEIAAALAWTPEELETVWEGLPLDDNGIAARLGATRQQVINLRKVARGRLERRLRQGEGEAEP